MIIIRNLLVEVRFFGYLAHFWALSSRMANAGRSTSYHSLHLLMVVLALQQWIDQLDEVASLQSRNRKRSSLSVTCTKKYIYFHRTAQDGKYFKNFDERFILKSVLVKLG